MKTLIIYDSFFGNTEKIARAIFQTFSPLNSIKICLVNDYRPEYLNDIDLLIIGSPTRGFRPTPAYSSGALPVSERSAAQSFASRFDNLPTLAILNVRADSLSLHGMTGSVPALRRAPRSGQ